MRMVILDCDPGMDDTVAIIAAAKSQNLNLIAVTTVNGNCSVELTCKNARKALELIGRTDIPVSRGQAFPLFRQSPKDPFSHGEDGQAENYLPEPGISAVSQTADDLIIDLVKSYPHKITIISTAPMTNIALAMIRAPEIKGMIQEIIAISGAFGLNENAFINATGNSPQSEWNVFVDPEAAKIVYESGVKLVALGLDVATNFSTDFCEEDLEKLRSSNRKEALFLLQAIDFVKKRGYLSYCTVIDALAIAYAEDSSFVELMKIHCGIETHDGLSLGMTISDRRKKHQWEHLPCIDAGYKADYIRFLKWVTGLMIQ